MFNFLTTQIAHFFRLLNLLCVVKHFISNYCFQFSLMNCCAHFMHEICKNIVLVVLPYFRIFENTVLSDIWSTYYWRFRLHKKLTSTFQWLKPPVFGITKYIFSFFVGIPIYSVTELSPVSGNLFYSVRTSVLDSFSFIRLITRWGPVFDQPHQQRAWKLWSVACGRHSSDL